MKVVLIVPPREYLLVPKSLPSLGILYVAKVLKNMGHEVNAIDFADGYKFVEADLYGISVTTPDFPESIKIMKWIKDRNPGAKVIAGGPHATLSPQDFLQHGFDGVIIGDGEVAIKKYLDGCKVAYGFSKDINGFYPDRSCIDLWEYEFYVGGLRATSLLTARGCVWDKCAFCSRLEKGVRYCSVEHVAKELKEIQEIGFESVMIYDDEFFTYPQRDRRIIELLAEYELKWRAFGRTDFILRNKELFDKAIKSGLAEVLIGIESGSNEILKIIEKGTTVKENKEAIKFLSSLGIKTKMAMIVGLPGESTRTLEETWKFCEEVRPYVSTWDFSICVPYPGSKIFTNPLMYDINFGNVYTAYKGAYETGWRHEVEISTSSLTGEEIYGWRDKFDQEFRHHA